MGRGRGASAAALRQPGIRPLRQRCPDSSKPHLGGFMGTVPPSRGLGWHTGVTASTPSPGQEPLVFPGLSRSEFCKILTWEKCLLVSQRSPSVAQRCPWGRGCAGRAVPPHWASPPAQLQGTSAGMGLEGGRRQEWERARLP